MLALLFRHLAVVRGAVEACGAEALVDLGFGVAAHAHGFPEEAAGVAFFEGGHEFFATWEALAGG